MSERATQRRGSVLSIIAGLAAVIAGAGCPEDPYKAETWTKKLGNSHESERAVTELEHLGDPSAIEPLGNAWLAQGKPLRLLQVIIALGRPLTPEQAAKDYVTDYAVSGRPATWDKAVPFLKKALSDVDDANPRSVDSAAKAADALGEAKSADGLDALIEIAQKPVTAKLWTAQVAAIRAIGKYRDNTAKAAAALIKLIDRDPPPNPRAAKQSEQTRGLAEKYALALRVSGAAINALGDLHAAAAAKPLVLALFRNPDLFTQVRRALVASGPAAADELRKVLGGSQPEVNQLIKDKHLDKYCGDKNDSLDQCLPVSAIVSYSATVLGDFYDAKAVPELLAALKQPAVPVAYIDDQPSPNTQYEAIFGALRKIGSPEGAATVRAMWMTSGSGPARKPARGKRGAAPAPAGETDLSTRILAVNVYPFLTRDDTGTDELAKIVADDNADTRLRQDSATAFARLAHDTRDISVLQGLAQKAFDVSAKRRTEADAKKPAADAADREYAKAKKLHDEAAKAARAGANAGDAVKKVDTAFADATKTHDQAVAAFKTADALANQYKGYARMFQTHIAQIEVAIRCKQDLGCFAGSLKLIPAEAARNNAPYIKDIKQWTPDEQVGLVEESIERAMLELGKRGNKSAAFTKSLLDSAKNDDRVIRQAILFALPKIAAVPCADCEAKLKAAIRAGEGKTTLADLNLETTMMKNYFAWAGGKTPSNASETEDLPQAEPGSTRKK
jgi:hypothetical protein